MSYVDRIKTDPVMNAVFNSRERMNQYDVRTYNSVNAGGNINYNNANTEHIDEPARRPGKYLRQANIYKYRPWANLGLPVTDAAGHYVAGRTFKARGNDNVNVHWRHNPNLYWINMIPKDLYNVNRVNKPNPIISSLKSLRVHISSLHPTFSS